MVPAALVMDFATDWQVAMHSLIGVLFSYCQGDTVLSVALLRETEQVPPKIALLVV